MGCIPAPAQPTKVAVTPAAAVTDDGGLVRRDTPDQVNIVKARSMDQEQLFAWADWSSESFERAKREGRSIIIHGAAEWCHWCHVMEETTYRDPDVGKLIRDNYVAIKVDVDSRPDIEERYGEWGWPATIILDSEANELGKYRGYMSADEMLDNLRELETAQKMVDAQRPPYELPVPVDALHWVGAAATRQMDRYFDAEQGSWGMRQKVPIGDNVNFELRRAIHGDEAALARAVLSLEKQAALIDPVWGGIYQYSTGNSWEEPHYEKLMTYQAANLEAYARGYQATGDQRMLTRAHSIATYINTFLSSPEGGYYVTQDADVGAHDRTAKFVDGDVYYRLDDAERRKLGIPWIDDNIYGEENGLAIAAMVALYAVTGDTANLARAQKAADLLLSTHVDPEGRVLHRAPDASQGDEDAGSGRKVYYAADAAAFGLALARLAEVTKGETSARYSDRAQAMMRRELRDETDGGYWANTPDPDAYGVFTHRRKPYFANVNAARLFAALGRLTSDPSWGVSAGQALAAIATPTAIGERGRMIGSYLLALDEAGALLWTKPIAVTPSEPPDQSAEPEGNASD